MSENPYLPPTNLGSPPVPNGWRLEGDTLFCLKGAQLPPVDPFTGESDSGLLPVSLHAQPTPRWLPLLMFASIVGCFASMTISEPLLRLLVIFPSLILNFLFVRQISLKGFCKISCYRSPATRRRMILWTSLGWIAFLPVLAILLMRLPEYPRASDLWLLIPIVLLVILVIYRRPQLLNLGKDGEFFRIGGIHPEALDFIRRSSATSIPSRSHTTASGPRVGKTANG